jgi:1-deoxy-D-xylulose-5-phosphate synthase
MEVRERIIDVVSRHKGAHFGSNLGTVELTIALHRVFETPRDQLVWDVGHQAYPHKILTGRNERFPTIRRRAGSRASCAATSPSTTPSAPGTRATSISAACGMAAARDLRGRGLRGRRRHRRRLDDLRARLRGAQQRRPHRPRPVVVLNDNQMSISPNVGAMHKYLTNVRTHPALQPGPRGGEAADPLRAADRLHRRDGGALRRARGRRVKGMFVPGMIFEELGFRYIGPVDGHDVDAAGRDLRADVRKMSGPALVHVLTTKGKGFAPAEEDQVKWHAGGSFDKLTGAPLKSSAGALPRYQAVFGEALTELGAEYPRVVAITAAMAEGTSTNLFGRATRSASSTWASPRARGHLRGGARDAGDQAGRRDLLHLPPARLRLDRPRRGAAGPARRLLHGPGGDRRATTGPRTTAGSTSPTCSRFRG